MSWQWWLGAGGAAALLGAAAFWLWRALRRRIRRRRRAWRLRYPVVLAHGIMGFDELELGLARPEYFRGIPSRLRKLGAEVHLLRVPMAASIAARAEEVARMVRALPADQVNIIAHSMGGLDARYAIARLGLASKVASLTTVGTPHRGTPIADISARVLGEGLLLRKLLGTIGVDVGGLYDLTTSRMEEFNRDVPDSWRVSYQSYLAKAAPGDGINPLLLPAHLYLRERVGDNDGLVPADSQRWGEVVGTVEADHWAQIGWSRKFDARAFYAAVVRELAARGF